jgi:hypothetical protein
MRPTFIIVLLLSIASMSTASMLFWNGSPKATSKRSTTQPTIDIKWGEGSEAGSPEAAIYK